MVDNAHRDTSTSPEIAMRTSQRRKVSTSIATPEAVLVPTEEIIEVPPDVRPGSTFLVTRHGKQFRITCPPNCRAGQKLRVRLVVPGKTSFFVCVPEGVQEGELFSFTFKGARYSLRRPANAKPNTIIRADLTARTGAHQWCEVEFKDGPGILPGKNGMAIVAGVRILVRNSSVDTPRRKFRFQVPSCMFPQSTTFNKPLSSRGWHPIYHVGDKNFHWFPFGTGGNPPTMQNVSDYQNDLETSRFHPTSSSWVPIIGDNGLVELIPSQENTLVFNITDHKDKQVANHEDILLFQRKNIKEKHEYFCHLSALLSGSEGFHTVQINKDDDLIGATVDQILLLTTKQLKRHWWRLEIVDPESNTKTEVKTEEWFQNVAGGILYSPAHLFEEKVGGDLEPSAAPHHGEDDIRRLRALGRVLGKALLQGIPLGSCQLRDYLFKYLSGYPLDMGDLKIICPRLFRSLHYFYKLEEEDLQKYLETNPLYFVLPSCPPEGIMDNISLLPGGDSIRVTSDNFLDYLEAACKYAIFGRLEPQLQALVLGFRDVMPHESLAQLFNPTELRLCLRGFPKLDVEEWQQFTAYFGAFEALGSEHPHIQWFWQVVRGMDYMTKMKLLQYIAGIQNRERENNHRPHMIGFDVLLRRGERRFAIRGMPPMTSNLGLCGTIGRGMGGNGTYFIELPPFTSCKELKQKLLSRLDVCSEN